MLDVYKRIKQLRINLGMSQGELADKTGYNDRSSIAKIEAGEVDLTQSKIVAFAKALNTTPGYLMGWDEEQAEQDRLDKIKAALQQEDGVTAEIIELLLALPSDQQQSALEYIRFLSERAKREDSADK